MQTYLSSALMLSAQRVHLLLHTAAHLLIGLDGADSSEIAMGRIPLTSCNAEPERGVTLCCDLVIPLVNPHSHRSSIATIDDADG